MQVRTNEAARARLFDWDSENNVISIIRKDKIYYVKLFNEFNNNHYYKIIDLKSK